MRRAHACLGSDTEAIQKIINYVEESISSDISIMDPIQETGTINQNQAAQYLAHIENHPAYQKKPMKKPSAVWI